MQITNPNPLVNAVLRIVQTHQAAAIAAAIDSQTETQPAGFEAVDSLQAIVAWEKAAETQVSDFPCLTVTAPEGEFIPAGFNEGQSVRHTILAEIVFYEDETEARKAKQALYGQVLTNCLLERARLSDYTAGVSSLRATEVRPRQQLFGARKSKLGFEGGAALLLEITVFAK